MSILARVANGIKHVVNNLSLTDEKAWDTSLWRLRGAVSASGENVTEYSALTYSAVYNAVTLISGTVASLPLHLMQRRDKRTTVLDRRCLYHVLHDQANPYMTAMAFRKSIMGHILL